MWLRSVAHGGREAHLILIFFRLARRSLPLPSLMRMKALNPYSKQTKAVTPGMSTSSGGFEPDWFQGSSVPEVNPHHLQMQTVHPPMKRNQTRQ